MEKKIRKGRVFAVVLILALVFIYAVYLVAKLVQNPTNTFMVTNGKISQEEFYSWSEEARQQKELCDKGIITLDEFRDWLKK